MLCMIVLGLLYLRCRSLEKEDDNLDYGTYDYDEGDIAEVNFKGISVTILGKSR